MKLLWCWNDKSGAVNAFGYCDVPNGELIIRFLKSFAEYMRMPHPTFVAFVEAVAPFIKKQETCMRKPIHPSETVPRNYSCCFTRGGMSLQHLPGTCSRYIFMCECKSWSFPWLMSPLHVPVTWPPMCTVYKYVAATCCSNMFLQRVPSCGPTLKLFPNKFSESRFATNKVDNRSN